MCKYSRTSKKKTITPAKIFSDFKVWFDENRFCVKTNVLSNNLISGHWTLVNSEKHVTLCLSSMAGW